MELDTRPSARSAKTTFPRSNQPRPASPRAITGTLMTEAPAAGGRDRREGETEAKTLRAIAAARAEFHIYRYPVVPVSRDDVSSLGAQLAIVPVLANDDDTVSAPNDSGASTSPAADDASTPRFTFSRRTAAILWGAASAVLLAGVAVFLKTSSAAGLGVLGSGAVLMAAAIVAELRQRGPVLAPAKISDAGSAAADIERERAGRDDFVEFRVPSNSDLRRYVLPPSFGLTIIAEQTMALIAESNGWTSERLGAHHAIFDLDLELNRVANKAWRLQDLRNDLGPAPETHSEGGNLRRQEDVDRAALALTERRVWESQNDTLDAVYLSLVRRVTALRSYQKNVRQLQTQEALLDRLQRAATTQSAISAFLIGAEIDAAESLVERSTQSLEVEVEQTKAAIAAIVTTLDADLAVFMQSGAAEASEAAAADAVVADLLAADLKGSDLKGSQLMGSGLMGSADSESGLASEETARIA